MTIIGSPDNLILPRRQEWRDRGMCLQIDPNTWFPAKGGSTRNAKKICATCPVQPECLEWALEHAELGVWGGFSERERRKIKKARAKVVNQKHTITEGPCTNNRSG